MSPTIDKKIIHFFVFYFIEFIFAIDKNSAICTYNYEAFCIHYYNISCCNTSSLFGVKCCKLTPLKSITSLILTSFSASLRLKPESLFVLYSPLFLSFFRIIVQNHSTSTKDFRLYKFKNRTIIYVFK